jgi:L-threonylcarbamoyladenylate synthase
VALCLDAKNLNDIQRAAFVLQSGGLVIFPTDTVYGLGASIYKNEAIDKLYKLTGRPQEKPLAILIGDTSWVNEFSEFVSGNAILLMEKFWPGPLTLVFKASNKLPTRLNINGKIGLRMPDDTTSLDIIKKLKSPIAAKSANFSGDRPPGKFNEIDKQLINLIDAVIKGGDLLKMPSTVVDVSEKKCKIIREGIITKKIIGSLVEI